MGILFNKMSHNLWECNLSKQVEHISISKNFLQHVHWYRGRGGKARKKNILHLFVLAFEVKNHLLFFEDRGLKTPPL